MADYISINRKLARIFWFSVGFCLVITSIAFSATLLFYSHRSFRQELSSVAQVAAATSRAALAFNDPEAGDRVLSALSGRSNLIYYAIVDASGKLLSERGERLRAKLEKLDSNLELRRWGIYQVQISAPVVLEGEVIGQLLLVSSLSQFYQQLGLLALIVIIVVGLTFLGTFYFRRALQRSLVEPIISLRDAAQHVSLTKDFSNRIEVNAKVDDEISQLIRTFNTMLNQLEERDRDLVSAKNAAEKADRLKSLFLATVSHELRTPLHAILGMTDEVLASEIDSEQRELLEIVKGSGKLLISIISDILDFSKIEAGKVTLSSGAINIKALLNGAVELFDLSARKKGLSLSAHVEDSVPESIVTDRGRLMQVIVNLLGNAIKFTENGTVDIAVSLKAKVTQNSALQLKFCVSDTGIGIPEADIPTIFDSFTQVSRGNEMHEGTGLGLAISARLVELLGGRIWVESTLGKGSTFSFIIETQAAEPQSVVMKNPEYLNQDSYTGVEEKTEKNLSLSDDSQLKVILVVEDNKVNSKLAERVLTKAGFKVLLAFDGQQALTILGIEHVDLVLMDVNMPVMDGIEATSKIRQSEKLGGERLPIIALTANVSELNIQSCITAGMNEYLTKPVEREELINTVNRYLQPRLNEKLITSRKSESAPATRAETTNN